MAGAQQRWPGLPPHRQRPAGAGDERAGRIVSLQAIFPRGSSTWPRQGLLSGGRKQGCFHVIGKPVTGQPIAIAEGYATAGSIHQATGWCVVVAWDAGNLARSPVPGAAPCRMASFVICADNDQWTRQPLDNPGVTLATRPPRRSMPRGLARVRHAAWRR
jgi:putative DNA primase/helicase